MIRLFLISAALLTLSNFANAANSTSISSTDCMGAMTTLGHTTVMARDAAKTWEAAIDAASKSCSSRAGCRLDCRNTAKMCRKDVRSRWNCAKHCGKAPAKSRPACKSSCGKLKKQYQADCANVKGSCKKRCKKLVKGSSCKRAIQKLRGKSRKLRKVNKRALNTALKVCRDAAEDDGGSASSSSGRARKPKARKKNKDRGACQRKCNKIRSKKHKVRCVIKC